MTITTNEAVEEPRSRTGRLYGAAAFTLAAALFLSVAGGAVTPLWPAAAAPPATAPAEPGAPVEPGVTEPEPDEPVAASGICDSGTGALTARVCEAARLYGWAITASGEIVEGEPFVAVLASGEFAGEPPLATGERFSDTSISGRETLVLMHTRDGSTTAAVEPLPPQSGASLAEDIRIALAQPEVWFFDGENIADGPSLTFGSGWQIATAHDAARSVGQVVTVGWVTLTVAASDPGTGTVYDVS